MKRTERSYTVAAPPERVERVLLEEAFHVALGNARVDVESTEVRWIEAGRVFEVHTEEYGRTRAGKLDRSRRKQSVTRYRWDASSRQMTWAWAGEGRIDISGGIHLQPDGPGTRITSYHQIEVRVALIGGRIERIIDREFEKSDESYRAIMREHLGL